MAWWEKIGLGRKVERATADLPAGVAAAIFNILGGKVLMTSIVGEVTTVVQTQLNNTKLTMNPTAGTATAIDLCLVLNITAWTVGNLLGITGIPTDAMIPAAYVSGIPGMTQPVILTIGTLDLDCSATNSGKIKWTMHYIPIDDGAYVTAA